MLLFSALAVAFSCATAYAQYPTKPVRWIVPVVSGGPVDIITRVVAARLSSDLGQPFIVENRGGAGEIVGTEVVAKSAPDGYTLLTTSSGTLVFQRFLYNSLPYDSQRDFTPVGMVASSPMGLFIHESVPARSLEELVAYTKLNPGKLNYGSTGGNRFHLAAELFQRRTGTRMVFVPYKGAGQFIPDLLAGRIELLFFLPVDQLLSQVKAGKLRALAMMTDQRFPALPDVPTFAESGVRDFNFPDWMAVVAPAGTQKSIIDRLNAEITKAVASAEVIRTLAGVANVPRTSSPDQLAEIIDRDIKTWGPLLNSLGIKLD